MNGTPTGTKWYISVQETDFGIETSVLLHTETHYVNVQPDGTMIMTPFEEGVRVEAPTLRFSSIHRPQLIAAVKDLLAPQLEERSREFGRLEGELAMLRRVADVESKRVDRVIGKLIDDVPPPSVADMIGGPERPRWETPE